MKILVVSHNSFSKVYNNGKTLSAIFSSFEKNELCQLYFTPLGEPDYDRCNSYYQITDKDALLSIVWRNKCGTSGLIPEEQMHVSGKRRKQNSFTLILRTIIWFFSSWKKGGLSQWINTQKPEAIFYVGGNSIFSHMISINLSKQLNIPLFTYFTDDYIINSPSTVYLRWLKYYYKKTIKQSHLLFAIGNQMADDYTEYFKRKFLPIMNIVDIHEVTQNKKVNLNEIKICYFGGLHLGRAEEISKFAEFLHNNCDKEVLEKIRIKVYSFDSIPAYLYEKYNELSIIKENGISGEDLKREMVTADIFLHVESTNPKYHNLTKLSVSTKIPEYMSLQKPIIAFGPTDVASFRVIADSNSSLVIDDINNEELMRKQADQLLAIIISEERMKAIARDNYEYAKNNFDKKIVSLTFRKQLENTLYN